MRALAPGVAQLARSLRPFLVMTQAGNAKARKFSKLSGAQLSDAGQKTRVDGQALPGAAGLEAFR
jgi:hypothetical protein